MLMHQQQAKLVVLLLFQKHPRFLLQPPTLLLVDEASILL
jgi:hypothetical protein